MRRWFLSAAVALAVAVPGYAAQETKAKPKEKQDAKQTQQAVKDARKHAKKADEQPYDAMRKADEDGKKATKEAKKTSRATNRFRGLDRDGNGIIERAEWNGDDRSFANQDWNRDGVLSGDEVKPGAKRPRGR